MRAGRRGTANHAAAYHGAYSPEPAGMFMPLFGTMPTSGRCRFFQIARRRRASVGGGSAGGRQSAAGGALCWLSPSTARRTAGSLARMAAVVWRSSTVASSRLVPASSTPAARTIVR